MTQNFTNNLSQGFAKIKDKAATLQQSLKLKSRLGELQKQKTALLAQLGWHALQAYRAGQPIADDAFVQQTGTIAQLDVEAAALEHELAVLEGRAQAAGCPQCGTPLAPGAPFCPGCGRPSQATAAPGAACRSCGSPMAPGAVFCGNCGARAGG